MAMLGAAIAAAALAGVAASPDTRPPAQTSLCAGCERPITEVERRPCPDCGSMNRLIVATAHDRVAVSDRVS